MMEPMFNSGVFGVFRGKETTSNSTAGIIGNGFRRLQKTSDFGHSDHDWCYLTHALDMFGLRERRWWYIRVSYRSIRAGLHLCVKWITEKWRV